MEFSPVQDLQPDTRPAQELNVNWHRRSAHSGVWVWPIYNGEWEVRREDFRCMKLFLYAVCWARSIYVAMTGTRRDEEDSERMDVVQGTYERSRLLLNLKSFTTDGCHAEVIRQ